MNAVLKALFIISLAIIADGIFQGVDFSTNLAFNLAVMYLVPYIGSYLTLWCIKLESKFRTAE